MQHKPDIDISLASSEDNIHTVSSSVMFRTPNRGDDDIHPIYRSQTSTSKRLRNNSIEETVKPKKFHLLKIIVYILVPFSILIPLAIFHFVDAVSLTKSETKLRGIMEQTIPRSVVIHLQSERYYASLHLRLPENFSASSLFEKIVETDSGLHEIQNSGNDVLEFQSYILSKLRQDVIAGSIDPQQCEHRYSLIIESITAKLIGDIRKVILGRLSEMVVSYYYFFRYKEELEILKIIGAFRLLISDRYEMKLYTDQLLRCLRGKSSLETSFRFSHSLKETYFKWVDVNSDLLSSIEVYKNNLLTKNVVYTEDRNEDLIKWLNLTNNLSSEFEEILVKLEQQLLQEIDVIISSSQASTAVFALFLSFVLSCTPLTLYVMIKLSSKALDMSEEMKTQLEELETQRERTDLLLYQMLPQQVADQLKYSCDFNAETFEAVTIYFSEVDNFVKICAESNPIEVSCHSSQPWSIKLYNYIWHCYHAEDVLGGGGVYQGLSIFINVSILFSWPIPNTTFYVHFYFDRLLRC